MTPDHEPDRDPGRDAWLREALRHAPDADAAPSAAISDSILRQARDAVNTPPPAPRPNPMLQWWSWLARPPVAAGFATVMVATLIGVMWWDKPLDETFPSRSAPTISVAPVAAPDSAALPAPVQAAAPESVSKAAPAPAPRPAAKPAAPARSTQVAPSRAPEPEADRRADRPGAAARDEALNAARERVADEARQRKAETAPAAPAAAPVAPPATTTAPAAVPAAVPSPAPPPPTAAAPAPVADSAGRVAPQGLAKSAPAPIAQALRASDAGWRTPTIDDPARWAWQRAGVSRAMSPALQRWLAQLDATARWQATDASPPPADTGTLKLWRSGALQATILLRDDAAWLLRPGRDALMTPLTADEIATLRAALAAATS